MPELVNPIFPAFAQVIETALAAEGFTPVLCTQTPGGVHEDDYVQMLLDRGVSGIIFLSGQHADATSDPARYQGLRERGLPIVLVNGWLSGRRRPLRVERRRRVDGPGRQPPGRSWATPRSGWPWARSATRR